MLKQNQKVTNSHEVLEIQSHPFYIQFSNSWNAIRHLNHNTAVILPCCWQYQLFPTQGPKSDPFMKLLHLQK